MANRSMAPGPLVPQLGYADVLTAAAWLCRVFGLRERLRIGTHHVQLHAGGGSVILVEASPSPPADAFATHAVMLAVTDVDAHFEHALNSGATIVSTPTTHAYGERQYNALDIGGHRWTFSQSVADIDPPDWGATVAEL